jgi:hypothetical protein
VVPPSRQASAARRLALDYSCLATFIDCNDLGHLVTKMVQTNRHMYFSLVYHLIELVLILLAATGTVERVFPDMNIMKTERRNNKIDDEWMNNCMPGHIERDTPLPETNALPSARSTQQSLKNTRQRLCRV